MAGERGPEKGAFADVELETVLFTGQDGGNEGEAGLLAVPDGFTADMAGEKRVCSQLIVDQKSTGEC